MKEYKEEIIMLAGVLLAYFSLILVKQFEYYSLAGSLLTLLVTSMYYGITFFRSNEPIKKFAYFLILMFLIIGYFALVYKAFGIIDTYTNEPIQPDWLNSIYFSVVTWTTLGYGDFKPTNELKVWVMAEALMGYIFMGIVVAKVLFLAQFQKPKNT